MVGRGPVSQLDSYGRGRLSTSYGTNDHSLSGAVFRGFAGNNVQVRKARCHYGTHHSDRYNHKIHSPKDPKIYWCKYREEWMISDRMTWYIHIVRRPSIRSEVSPKTKYINCFNLNRAILWLNRSLQASHSTDVFLTVTHSCLKILWISVQRPWPQTLVKQVCLSAEMLANNN